MLTVYYVRIAQSLPSQTIRHMLPAAQAVSADHTHTHHKRHKPTAIEHSRFIRQPMNRCERLIRTFMK